MLTHSPYPAFGNSSSEVNLISGLHCNALNATPFLSLPCRL